MTARGRTAGEWHMYKLSQIKDGTGFDRNAIFLDITDNQEWARICKRYNTHETLTAENARLREALRGVIDAEDARSALDSPETMADVYRAIESARAALATVKS